MIELIDATVFPNDSSMQKSRAEKLRDSSGEAVNRQGGVQIRSLCLWYVILERVYLSNDWLLNCPPPQELPVNDEPFGPKRWVVPL